MSGDDETKKSDFFKNTTRRIDNADLETRRLDQSADKTTERMDRNPSAGGATQPVDNPADDGKTRLYRPAKATGAKTPAETTDSPFVVGWLVVLKGPGRGASLPIGYGVNSVGRGAGQRVSLAFGDEEISRENHCSIIFDDKNVRFFINHGGSQNLTYLNDNPVLAPAEIEDGAKITIGDTELLFKPLCGPNFSWSTVIENDAPK